jgi:hypothetical protein
MHFITDLSKRHGKVNTHCTHWLLRHIIPICTHWLPRHIIPIALSGSLIGLSDSLFLAPQSDLEKKSKRRSKGLGEKRPNPGWFGSPP